MDELIERTRLAAKILRDIGGQSAMAATVEEAAAALEAMRGDTDRIAFLAMEPVIEGFVGVDRDVYDYACDCAEENGRDEPNDEDHINAMRRLIDAAIDQARGKGGCGEGVGNG